MSNLLERAKKVFLEKKQWANDDHVTIFENSKFQVKLCRGQRGKIYMYILPIGKMCTSLVNMKLNLGFHGCKFEANELSYATWVKFTQKKVKELS